MSEKLSNNNPLALVSEVARAADLVTLRMTRGSFETMVATVQGKKPHKLSLQLKSDSERVASSDDPVIRVLLYLRFAVLGPDLAGRAGQQRSEFDAAFELDYKLPRDATFSDEQVSAFSRINGLYNAWPYFREFVQNATCRMGLPALTLPLLTAADAAMIAEGKGGENAATAASKPRRKTKAPPKELG